MAGYASILNEMVRDLDFNMILFKEKLETRLTSCIRSVEVHLEQLDEKHFQQENGVEPLALDGCVTALSHDEISINPIVAEPDAVLHNFAMRTNCYLVGRVAFIRPGNNKSSLFNIIPYRYGTSEKIVLFAKSNCDIGCEKTIEINITLDSKKRISILTVSNIKLSDFPNARKEFLAHINNHVSLVHAETVYEKSNNLAFEYAKARVLKL